MTFSFISYAFYFQKIIFLFARHYFSVLICSYLRSTIKQTAQWSRINLGTGLYNISIEKNQSIHLQFERWMHRNNELADQVTGSIICMDHPHYMHNSKIYFEIRIPAHSNWEQMF